MDKDNSLENEMTARKMFLKMIQETEAYQYLGFRHLEEIAEVVDKYALSQTTPLREQLEKLQEENKGLQWEVKAESQDRKMDAEHFEKQLKSSQEETSLLKSQLEEAKKDAEYWERSYHNTAKVAEEKDREIERLKGGHAEKSAAGEWVNVYEDDEGRFISDESYSTHIEAFRNRDKLSGYLGTYLLSTLPPPSLQENTKF